MLTEQEPQKKKEEELSVVDEGRPSCAKVNNQNIFDSQKQAENEGSGFYDENSSGSDMKMLESSDLWKNIKSKDLSCGDEMTHLVQV